MRQTVHCPAKMDFFSFQLIVLFYPGECYEKFFPSPQWLRTRTSNAYLVRIVKIIKMSMQKKKKICPRNSWTKMEKKKKRDLHYYSIYLKKTYWFYLVCSIDIPERE